MRIGRLSVNGAHLLCAPRWWATLVSSAQRAFGACGFWFRLGVFFSVNQAVNELVVCFRFVFGLNKSQSERLVRLQPYDSIGTMAGGDTTSTPTPSRADRQLREHILHISTNHYSDLLNKTQQDECESLHRITSHRRMMRKSMQCAS